MSVDVVGGKVRTVLRSGSDVHVKAGQARIELIEGGHITICGPAHFSVLKSGGSLTLALDTGTIHACPANRTCTHRLHSANSGAANFYRQRLHGNAGWTRFLWGDVYPRYQRRRSHRATTHRTKHAGTAEWRCLALQWTTGNSTYFGRALLVRRTAILSSSSGPVEVSTLASSEELKKKAAEKKSLHQILASVRIRR